MNKFFGLTIFAMLAGLIVGCGGNGSMPSISSRLTPQSLTSVPEGVLASGSKLTSGQSLLLYTQSHNKYELILQSNGNLVLYELESNPVNPSIPLWATNTTNGHTLQMNLDGNLALYDTKNRIVWASGTSGHPGAILQIQDNANLVITKSNTPIWATNSLAGYGLNSPANLVSFPNLKQLNGQIAINSSNAMYSLFISNGNLVLEKGSTALWSTKTNNGSTLRMQPDGNLVLYTATNVALWSSGTWNKPGGVLSIESNGTLVLTACRSHGLGYVNTTGASGCLVGSTYPLWSKAVPH